MSTVSAPGKLSLNERAAGRPTPASSDAARLAKRFVIAALEDHYDDVNKRYKPGHSDKTIAKEAGCAEAVVADLREDMFGPIGEPDEFSDLRAKIAAAEAACESILAEFTAKAKQAHSLVTGLAQELERVAIANGWKR